MLNFLKYRWLYLVISASVLVPGIYSLAVWGLKPAIDFTGGSIIELNNEQLTMNKYKEEVTKIFQEKGIEIVSLQEGDEGRLTIKTKPISRETWEEAKTSLEERIVGNQENSEANEKQEENQSEEVVNVEETVTESENKKQDQQEEMLTSSIEEIRFETVGPVLGRELLQKTLIAAIIAVFGILAYIAWAFKDAKFGLAAVAALLHDLLVVTGIFSLLGHFFSVEVDTLFVTAVLTTMSFSVHDTIVVFDRIRESLKKENLPLDITVNKALTETMSRSVNNSMTIVFMLLALVLLGGETIKWFVTALLVGTISGTYSSPFVAAPIMYFLKKRGK